MRRDIFAGFKRYNANTKDVSTGDCVKRSLAIAFRMDYDEVSRQLNQIKRAKRYTKFNIRPVFEQFIKDQGVQTHIKLPTNDIPLGTTVKEFCELSPEGTYVLLVGDKKSPTNHMVTVIDGDYWDSWDSSEDIVAEIYVVSYSPTEQSAEITVDDIFDEIHNHVVACLEKSHKKMPYATFQYGEIDRINKYTIQQVLAIQIDADVVGDSIYKWWRPKYEYTIKVNPRLSLEENLTTLKSKLWVKIREWAYAARKEVEDSIKAKQVETHKEFHGRRDLLIKLPTWCQQLVTYCKDEGSNEYSDRYTVYMDALPEDPRAESYPEVSFYAETLSELRSNIDEYKKNYARFGFDY